MTRFGLSSLSFDNDDDEHFDYDYEESKIEHEEEEDINININIRQEPPHPLGFGSSPWGKTWISLEPPRRSEYQGRSTYALDLSDSDDDDDNGGKDIAYADNKNSNTDIEDDGDWYNGIHLRNKQQSYPPLYTFIHSSTAPTKALLQYREPKQDFDDDDDDGENSSSLSDEDDVEVLAHILQHCHQRRQQSGKSDLLLTSPTKPMPSRTQLDQKIQQRMQLEKQRMEQEHEQANHELHGLVKDLEQQAKIIVTTRKAEADALKKKEEEHRLRQEAQIEKEHREREQRELEEKQEQEKREVQRQEDEAKRKAAAEKAAQATEYITKAKKLVAQLTQVRASIEPFDKNKAISKRRLGMKKIVRGKVNTLSDNAAKVQEVAMEVSQAITTARQEDEQIKQALERKDPGLTPDMARGKRYLVDLLASNTIQRVQADGFNGPRGDGFPLAAMLSMVSLENKELVPILAAHIYTVCPTAIPALPSLAPDASEDDVMASLGMLKDKNGEFETFDKFLSRTEVSQRKDRRQFEFLFLLHLVQLVETNKRKYRRLTTFVIFYL